MVNKQMAKSGYRKRRELRFYKKEIHLPKGLFRNIIEYILIILITAFIAYVAVRFLGKKTAVVGNSMEPCLESSQEVVVDRLITVIKNPARGEVIAFLPKGNEKTHYYIKRVIGLPGETIQIKGGRVYIDGTLYDDPYGEDMIMDPGLAANEFVLGDEEFFVLGDNRNYSEDSRSGNIGAVKKEDIYGKVWYKKKTANSKGGFVKR